ncbi:MAG: GNAT family N-acetyltransferase [Bacteroides sp.]|nr:GNAT family N-acetyltransferase [Ruminococcus flavefaciens]MCM1555609.1 GNAT family N-acetyltransferase [Bacteroides sp.]
MKDIEICQFTDDYTDAVIELVLHFQNDGTRPPVTVEDQPDLLDIGKSYIESNGNFWIAKEKTTGKLIGTIGLMLYGEEIAVLKKFFVCEDYQGEPYHIGRRLYDELMTFAKSRHIKTILLDTPKNTVRAHNFYKKAGFRLVSENELPIRYSHPHPDCDFFLLDLKD